jgi:hypothetical protein
MRRRRYSYGRTRNMAKNGEIREKYGTHSLGPGIWQETV